MANNVSSPASVSPKWQLDPSVIFAMLSDPLRYELLLRLVKNGPKPAVELKVGKSPFLDVTLKALAVLTQSGLVVKLDNPQDRRRPLYALNPLIVITTTPKGPVLDFDSVTIRV